jgi:fluoride ion exporter CrcB/FEX
MMGIVCSVSGPVGSLLKPSISLFFNLFEDDVALLLGFGTSGGLTAFSAIVSCRVRPLNAMIWSSFHARNAEAAVRLSLQNQNRNT